MTRTSSADVGRAAGLGSRQACSSSATASGQSSATLRPRARARSLAAPAALDEARAPHGSKAS